MTGVQTCALPIFQNKNKLYLYFNLISGLFLVLERPFKIGDLIEVDGSTGTVHSIEMLSTYIRTFDNRVIRIPNEMLAKSKLINLTHYPIRRIDLDIRVACKEEPGRVMTVLREVIIANPSCFNEPEPLILFNFIEGRRHRPRIRFYIVQPISN